MSPIACVFGGLKFIFQGKVYRIHRRRDQDGRYNAKRLHDTNTTPHGYNTTTRTIRQKPSLNHLQPNMARGWHTELLGRATTEERNYTRPIQLKEVTRQHTVRHSS